MQDKQSQVVDNLVLLIRRMIVRFGMINDHAGDRLAEQAMDYLRRTGLADGGGVCRVEADLDINVRVIEGCEHTLEEMQRWNKNGGCPICLTALLIERKEG